MHTLTSTNERKPTRNKFQGWCRDKFRGWTPMSPIRHHQAHRITTPQIHRVVVQTWTNTHTHFSGPVVEYILEKALPVFPRLHDLDVSGMVKFYDGLQKISMRYLLPLMPFDSICLAFGYEGLCPPGLGTTRYSAIASDWMDVLPRLLPQKESLVESAIFPVSVESNNGFDLLWRILEIAVPGFKSMNPVQVPSWTPQTDVLSFCWEHLLYFRLQSKHNMFLSALRNIQLSDYADVVTTLQSQVHAYLVDDDDGYLPANLCVILIVMDGIPPRGIGPSARISVVALSFLGCNAMHVSRLGMRLPAVTC